MGSRNILVASGAVLVVNSIYLALFATPSLFYYGNVAMHVVLGAATAVLAVIWLRRRERPTPASWWAAALPLAAGTVLGIALVATGNTRRFHPLLVAHIACMTPGTVIAIGLAVASLLARRPSLRLTPARIFSGLAVVALAGWGAAVVVRQAAAERAPVRIVNPATTPVSMDGEGAGPASPFFPSSANTNVGHTIPSTFFMTSDTCGSCHRDIYDQWKSSMHHFSSFNNQWYRKSIEYMQDVNGVRSSKWCAGCHDHAVFFNGRFDRPIKDQIDTPEAQAGLACTSCHSISSVHSTMGQGDFTIEYPPLHDLAASSNPILKKAHDTLLYLDPEPHRRTFLQSFHTAQTPEFCSACHKVHLDVPVNNYRWSRGFNDYDNWQASGVSGQGARSFYYPPKPQMCADCHMPLVASADPAAKGGMIHSHRFPAANTAIPFVNGDKTQLGTTQAFLQTAVSVDIFGLVRGAEARPVAQTPASQEPSEASTFAVGEESMNFGARQGFIATPSEVVGPLDKIDATVTPGESVRLEVVVRTRKVGHFFPGGTVDAFDVWVEFEALDEQGRTVFHSGAIEDGGRGPVESGAHFYRSLLIDAHGNQINKRNAWAARSVAYVRLIPPGAADTIHYRLTIPPDAKGRITLRAKVNYRKFAWWNTQWAFAGVRAPGTPKDAVGVGYDDGVWQFTGDTSHVSGPMKAIPDIPTTILSQAQATLRVAPPAAGAKTQVLDPSVRERWNDYGIGLLLQGDLKGAEAAFLKVTQMEPGYPDGWVNVARAQIQEGNMTAAEGMLQQALTRDPKLAKTHFFLGTVLKTSGRYDEALAHLREASAQYPRDRVVLNQIGRVLFLQRQFAPAVQAFQQVLSVDPEDLQAHYNLMLCYRGLGNNEQAGREEQLYERFKADESSQAITGPYRQLHPDDNNERQSIHEHKDTKGTNGTKGTKELAGGAR
ncbi:MAG TPA: tetratricopeptide repeat protein [Vicinamibacterales bacterium]